MRIFIICKLLKADSFSRSREDAGGFVVNEAAAKRMGPDPVIGRWLLVDDQQGPIIGVVKDFHYRTLRYPVQPFIFRIAPPSERLFQISFRIAPGQTERALAYVNEVYKKYSGDTKPMIQSLTAGLNSQYDDDERVRRLLQAFAVLAAAIAGLGIFGLAACAAEGRRHEIVMKKIMGATPHVLISEMLTVYSRWMFWALGLAVPAAYYLVWDWLNQFAVHISMDWQTFVLCGGGVWVLVLGIASYWVMNTVSTPPAIVLRNE